MPQPGNSQDLKLGPLWGPFVSSLLNISVCTRCSVSWNNCVKYLGVIHFVFFTALNARIIHFLLTLITRICFLSLQSACESLLLDHEFLTGECFISFSFYIKPSPHGLPVALYIWITQEIFCDVEQFNKNITWDLEFSQYHTWYFLYSRNKDPWLTLF